MVKTKKNIRSFRYDDEIARIIDEMSGESYNQKFENLVYQCYRDLPNVRSQVTYYQGRMENLIQAYSQLRQIHERLEKMDALMDQLEDQMQDITEELNRLQLLAVPDQKM